MELVTEQPVENIVHKLMTSKIDFSNRNRSEIYQILEEINKEGNIRIDVMGAYVPPELRVAFVKPFLFELSNSSSNRIVPFLKHSKSIHVNITGRSSLKWDVLYNGVIENDKGSKFVFENISNGLCVTSN